MLAIITVNSLDDGAIDHSDDATNLTLRDAIALAADETANPGADEVVFDASLFGPDGTTSGTVTLDPTQEDLETNSDLTITGPGAELLTIDAGRTESTPDSECFRVMTIGDASEVTITGVTITGGRTSYGGGIYNNDGTVTVTQSTISGNSAQDNGGGIYNNDGTVTVTQSTISGNSAQDSGGGIYNDDGTVTVTQSTISGNSAQDNGGGIYNAGGAIPIYNYYWGTLTVTQSTINGNSADCGGGVCNDAGILTVTQSTISENSADHSGGGVSSFSDGTLMVTQSTISGNSTRYYGGGIYSSGMVTINNTIVALNRAERDSDMAGQYGDAPNHSLVGLDPGFVTTPSAGADGDWGTEDDVAGDFRLASKSIAIDYGDNALAEDAEGNPLTTDLDGNTRVVNGIVDIGAYEYQSAVAQETASSEVTTLSDLVDATDTLISLREAIFYVLVGATTGTEITFAGALFSGGPGKITLSEGQLIINTDLGITGPGAEQLTVDADQKSRVFCLTGDSIDVTLNGLTITGGQTTGNGGGIYNGGAALAVTQSTINGNSALSGGGGIYNYYGTLTVTQSTISGNLTESSGGGIDHYGGMLTVTQSTITGNSARYCGGGILSDGPLMLTQSTISGNSAQVSDGGGIYSSGTLTVTQSTISGNSAQDNGGGIHNSSGPLTVTQSTISGNSAQDYGGGIYNNGTLTIINTIVALNRAERDSDMAGQYGDASNHSLAGFYHSLVGLDPGFVTTPSAGADGDWGTEDDVAGDFRLASKSIAIDYGDNALAEDAEGNPLTTDLDGNTRVVNGIVDIGAYEYQSAVAQETASSEVTTLSDLVDATDTLISLREAIFYVLVGATTGTEITFAGALFSGGPGKITLSEGQLIINTDLGITGPGAEQLTVDADQKSRVFCLTGDSIDVTLNGLTITGGQTTGRGGGVYNDGAMLTVTQSTISGNSGLDGGGIYNNGGVLTLTQSTISGNSTRYYGGGIDNDGGTLTVTQSAISGNSGFRGGGIHNDSGSLVVTQSRISGNSAEHSGGGVYNDYGTLTVTQSTISRNAAGYYGGGICKYGTVTINNTIVALNTASSDADIRGSYVNTNDSSLIGFDPLFVDPNGGDYRLQPGSPAINAGDNTLLPADTYDLDGDGDVVEPLPVDLNGNPRVLDANVDIGAFESLCISVSQSHYLEGNVEISLDMAPGAAFLKLSCLSGGERENIGTGTGDDFSWDTTTVDDGPVSFVAEYFDEEGMLIEALSRRAIVANNVDFTIHREPIMADATWVAGVHVVTEKLEVAAEATLTIEPGAIVKFCDGTSLSISSGASLTVDDSVIFTHIADDTVGGDTNFDEDATLPQSDAYSIAGSGTISLGDSELRYLIQEYSGMLWVGQTWLARQVIRITADVIIPYGVQLDIQPGAIIKFDPGTSIIVESGGTLNAIGNLTNPIVFTSIHDDAYGGDTNCNDDATRPEAGDWHQIYANGGTVHFDYVHVSYCSQSNNEGGLYLSSGGAMTFDNSIITETQYDAMRNNGGTFTAENSIFTESSLALRPSSGTSTLTNCTIANVTTAVRGVAGTLTNCVFANITDTIEEWGPCTFQYCAFWNPTDFGPQSTSQVGANGNIWADPKFRDAENGDFRLLAGSPLIDAGDGTVAPVTDALGRERFDDPYVVDTGVADADGACPDIGVYEMVESATSDLDVTVNWLEGPSVATVGGSVELRWQVTNIGTKAISGVWRDTITMVSDAGQQVTIGDVQQTASIGVGESIECAAEITIPAASDGDWRFEIQLNAYRDFFEGQNIYNNVRQSDGQCTIAAPMLPCEGLTAETVSAAESKLYKLTLPAGQSLLIAGESTEPISIIASSGFAPTESSFDWQASGYGDYQCSLSIPESTEERTIYLRVSTTRPDAIFDLSCVFDPFSLDVVSTDEISNSGSSTLTVTGSGFEPGMTFRLQQGPTTPITGELLDVASASSASVRFDMTGAATGAYTLSVTSANGLRTASLSDAVTVIDGVGESLGAWLEIPEAVREGRVYMGYACYANTGDVDILAPILYVKSNSGLRFAASPDDLDAALDRLTLLGTSPTGPAGILKPGESSRVAFYFVAGETNRIQLSSLSNQSQSMEQQEYWDTWQDYQEAIADAATRLARRGGETCGYQVCHELAVRTASGLPTAAVSGHLRNEQTGEAMAGVELHGVYHDGTNDVATIVSTDEAGYFQFGNLPEGVDLQINCYEAFGLSQSCFSVSGGDVNDVVLTALPYGTISGRISDLEGAPLEGIQVLASGGESEAASAVSDATGCYRITGLSYDTYAVGVFLASVEGVVVANGQEVSGVDFSGNNGSILGSVVDQLSCPVVGTLVIATDEDGNSIAASSDDGGQYCIEGLPKGVWTVETRSNTHVDAEPIAVAVGRGESLNADFQLMEGASISGTVINSLGEPVQDVQVCASDGDVVCHSSTTDEDGCYQILGLAVGSYELTTRYFGNVDVAFAECVINSLDEQVLGVDTTLAASAAVSGQILDASDATPIADAVLHLHRNGLTGSYIVEPDEFGVYVISDVAPGVYHVEVTAPGYAKFETMIDAIGSSTITLDVTLETGGTLTGRVVSADSQSPISDAHVVLLQSGFFYDSVVSDEDGSYLFEEIPEGQFACMAFCDSLAFPPVEIDMTSAAALSHDFVASGISFAGSVLANDGVTPLDGGNVLISLLSDDPIDSFSVSSNIAEDGTYQFSSLLAGTYSVVVDSEAGVAAFEYELAGTSTCTFVLPPQHQVSVCLEGTDASLLSQAEYIVVYTSNDVFLTSMSIDESLVAQFNSLPEGDLQFVVLSGNRTLVSIVATIDSDRSLNISVSNDGLSERTFVVRDPNTRLPLANQFVEINVVGTLYTAFATTDENGLVTVLLPDGAEIAAISDTAVLVEPLENDGSEGLSNATAIGNVDSYGAVGLVSATALSVTPWAMRLDRLDAELKGLSQSISAYPDELTECSCDCDSDHHRLFPTHNSKYQVYLSAAAQQSQDANALSEKAAKLTAEIVDRAQSVALSATSLAVRYATWPVQWAWTGYSLWRAATDLYNLRADIAAPLLNVIDGIKGELSGITDDIEEIGEQLYGAGRDLLKFRKVALKIRATVLANTFVRVLDRLETCGKQLANANKYTEEFWIGENRGNIEDFKCMKRALKSVNTAVKAIGQILALADIYTVINGIYMIANNLTDVYSTLDEYESITEDIGRNVATADYWRDSLPACVCDPPEEEEDDEHPKRPQSCDPNEIVGPIGYDTPVSDNWIQDGQEMTYTVYFENLETATAAAQEIFVNHQLSEYLDWSTFQMQEVVFSNQIVSAVEGMAGGSVTVDQDGTSYQVIIDTSIDYATGEVAWYLRCYDPSTFDHWPSDPYAGFLPPNDETHCGEGYITFTVMAKDDLETGDTIYSEAEIVFDTNDPIVTDPSWTNTIDVDTPTSSVAALPDTVNTRNFTVAWAGEDVGSGVASYDVYVAEDGGAWTLWLDDMTETSAEFTGQSETVYSFYSLAQDNVGQVEDKIPTAEATVYVVVENVAPTADAGGPYNVSEGGTVQLDASGSTDADLPDDTLSYAWDFDGDGQYDDATGVAPTFSAAGLDGPATVMVGLRVTDDDGASDVTTAEISVENASPNADAGGPYTVVEGGSVQLDASGSSDPGGDTLTYAWDFDGDGQYDDATGVAPTFSAAGLDGPLTVTVGLLVTDDDGASDTATVDVTVENADPEVMIGSDQSSLAVGQAASFQASVSDPGQADTAELVWQCTYNGLDFASGRGMDFSFVPTEAGVYVIIVTATDDDGGIGDASLSVTAHNDLGTVDFHELNDLRVTQETLYYRLTTAYSGILTLDTASAAIPANLEVRLYSQDPLAHPDAIAVAAAPTDDDKLRLDYAVDAGVVYYIAIDGDSDQFDLRITNLVERLGTTVTVRGTDDDDEFVFDASNMRAVRIKGVQYEFADAEAELIEFDGGDGCDVAWLYDSAGNEAMETWPDRATFVNEADDLTADFTVNVTGIESVQAYATRGGVDQATLHGSEAADKFKSYEDFVRLRAKDSSYASRAKAFDTIAADSGNDGNDLAVFNGTEADEAFRYDGAEDTATIMADGRYHSAIGFEAVIARGGGGNEDVAFFTDTADDDVLYFKSHKTVLVNSGMQITARAFDEAYATASEGGFDVARIYDTAADELLEVGGDTARLYHKNGTLDLMYAAIGFERVKAYSTAGDDSKDVQDHTLELLLYGWDE